MVSMSGLASKVLLSLVVLPFMVGRAGVFLAGWSAAAQHYADTQKYIDDYGCNTGGALSRSARGAEQCMQAKADLQVWPVWRGIEATAANAFGLSAYTFHILFIWENFIGKLLIIAVLALLATKIYGGAESLGRTRAEWKLRQQTKQWAAAQQQQALSAIVQRELSRANACIAPPPAAETLTYRGALGRTGPAIEAIDGGAPPRQQAQEAW